MRCVLLSVLVFFTLTACQQSEPLASASPLPERATSAAPVVPSASAPAPPSAVLKTPRSAAITPAPPVHIERATLTLFQDDPETSTLSLLVVEEDGSLCSLDPCTGALRWKRPGRAIDVLAGQAPGTAWVIEPAMDDEDGRLLHLQVTAEGAALVEERPFGGLGGRLLGAGAKLLGLSLSEGATLFVSGEGGEDWGRSWIMPRSVITQTRAGADPVALALTEDGALWRAEVQAGAIDKQGPLSPVMPQGATPQALVVGSEAPLLLASMGDVLSLLDLEGATVASYAHALQQGGWVDEARTSSAGVWALTGPSAELLLLSQQARLSLSATLSPAPWQGRRLAVHASQAWLALGDAVVSVRMSEGGLSLDPGFTAACTGSVVATVRLP